MTPADVSSRAQRAALSTAKGGIRTWELPIVAAVLAVAVAALPTLFDGGALWTKRFWLDEQCCTLYPVYDSGSFFELFGNVKRSEIGPPLLHVIVWTVGKITGSLSPTVIRSIMLVSVVVALLILWYALRRRYSASASAPALLAVAGHGLVLQHAFDGRFYGPWLFFAVGYAASLGIDTGLPRSRRRDVAIALFAVALCTIHWFGVTSLGLMAAAAVAAHGRRWRDGLRLVAPSVAGLVALLLLVPMLRFQLRQGGDEILWVQPLSVAQIMAFLTAFVWRLPIVLGLLVILVDTLRAHEGRPRLAPVVPTLRDPVMAAMLATGLMTLVLIVISAALNPVMVPRYAIASVLLAAPIVAVAAESVRPWMRIAMALWFTVLLVQRMQREMASARYFATVTDTYAAIVDQLAPENVPLVFQSYFMMYPVDGQARQRSRIRVLDLPDSTIRSLFPDAPESDARIAKMRLDRNQARLHDRVFGFPIPATKAQLDTTFRFYLLGPDMQSLGQQLFPRHRSAQLHEVVTIFERQGARP